MVRAFQATANSVVLARMRQGMGLDILGAQGNRHCSLLDMAIVLRMLARRDLSAKA